jgi:drug/metabolite transporter (DMT)-like permease
VYSEPVRAAIFLILATLFWAGNFVVGQAAVQSMVPLQLTFWRWALAAVPLLVLAQLVDRPDWKAALRHWPRLLLLSSLGMSAYTLLLYAALQHTSALNASLVTAANPVLIMVLAAVLLRDRPRPLSWLGLGFGLAGVLLVLTAGQLERLLTFSLGAGELLILAAITVWGLYTVLARRVAVPAVTSTAIQATVAAVALAPVAAATGAGFPSSQAGAWSLAFIVVFPSLGSYLLWNLALKRTAAANAGNYLNLIAVFTAIITVLLGQPVTAAQVCGGLLVIAGVLLTGAGQRPQRPRSSKSTSSPGSEELPRLRVR